MRLFFNNLYKKRVVSTLFLYLLILSCDFEAPQKWEKPTWYLPMTIPLINQTYTFEGLVKDSIIVSDSINNVIQIEFAASLGEPQGIPNNTFNINMPAIDPPQAVEPEVYDIELDIPSIDFPPIINPIFQGIFDNSSNCFPPSMFDTMEVYLQPISDTIPLPSIEVIDGVEIKELFISEGSMDWEVKNNWSVPLRVKFELKNGDLSFFKAPEDETIEPYSTSTLYSEIIKEDDPKSFFPLEPLTYSISIEPYNNLSGTNGGCEVYYCNVPGISTTPFDSNERCMTICGLSGGLCTSVANDKGWIIQDEIQESLEFIFNISFDKISAVVANIDLNLDEGLEPIGFDLPAPPGVSIMRAKFDTSSVDYPNNFKIILTNDFVKDLNMIMNFQNIYNFELNSEGNSILKESLIDTIVVKAGETSIGEFKFSNKFLSGTDTEVLSPVEEIKIIYELEFSNTGDDTLYLNDGSLSIGAVNIDSIVPSNLGLKYIEAVADTFDFPPIPSTPISGIPDGFSGFEFYDIIMGIEFFSEIGMPINLELALEASKPGTDITKVVNIETGIGAPYRNNHGCTFNTTGDTAKTIIKLNKDYQFTEYYCSPLDLVPSDIDTNIWYTNPDCTGSITSIAGLMNFGPENLSFGGEAKIVDQGILAPGSNLWGKFSLIAPLAFIFNESINIIPAGATPIAPMDPSSSSQIDSALVEAGLNVVISNSSALGGNLSLLVSDSTIFPLFLDSLITGTWENQLYDFNETIWDTLDPPLEIDSIYFQAIDPNVSEENRQALKVEFYKNSKLQFFIGRMFKLGFPATDSVEYNLGYINPDFPEVDTSILVIDKTRMNWVLSEENRYNIAMINFDKSIVDPRDNTQLVPLTFQTTNFLDVQAYLTLILNVGQLGREEDIIDE